MFIDNIIHGYLNNVIATKTVKGETTCVSIILLGNVIQMERTNLRIMQSSIKYS